MLVPLIAKINVKLKLINFREEFFSEVQENIFRGY